MNIAICADERFEAVQLELLIGTYAQQHDYNLHCRRFDSGEELLAQMEKYDLYFLNFQTGERNGVALAHALKEKFHRSVCVCYLTNDNAPPSEVIKKRSLYCRLFEKAGGPAEAAGQA